MEKISKTNEKFKALKDLLKTGKPRNLTVTDDLQVLEIIYNEKINIIDLYYTDTTYHESTYNLLENLKTISNNVYEISESTYESLALKENHAGIIAVIEMPKYTYDDFKKLDYLVVLDHLEIPGNVGTIYRTCDSAKVDGIILVDSITKYNNPKITSSSRGCNLLIPTLELSYDEALKFLIDNNYDIFLGEPKLGLGYQEYDYKNKIAITVGNERFGINPDWYNHNNKKVYIPMDGHQNSLNVSVAASILIYEAYMKRK